MRKKIKSITYFFLWFLQILGISLDNYTMVNILADYKKSSLKWMFRGIMVLSITQNQLDVVLLKELDAEEKLKERNPEDEVVEEPPVIGESGLSLEVAQTFQEMFKTVKLSDNSILSDRILVPIE
jgi:hypothetical protein